MRLSHRDHPVWPLLRQVLILATIGFMLWANYNSVDARDLLTMLVAGLVGGISEGLGRWGKHDE